VISNGCGTEGWDMLIGDYSLHLASYNLSEADQTLTIIQMHFVVHVRREKLLRLLSNQNTLFLLPNPWNYSTLIYLDQLALHPYMGVNMDWL